MSQSSPDSDPVSPDDMLPPVEPPSASFILQLFVVPGVIVVAIVLVWLLFTWVARAGNDPTQYIAGLQRPGPGRWQVASNLANTLRDERYEDFKRDPAAAQQLAAILAEELEAGSLDEKPVTLRVFLARALGEFYVTDGLPVLIEAATTERDPVERDVRRAALEAIALLAKNVQRETGRPLDSPELDAALRELARDDDPQIRVRVAFALGVLGGEEDLALLATMLRDANADVRYNAATGLARHGRLEAIDTLVEMLDPAQQEGVELEQHPEMRETKRALITVNALRAARLLAAANPAADLAPLIAAMQELAQADVPTPIQVEARETLEQLQSQGS